MKTIAVPVLSREEGTPTIRAVWFPSSSKASSWEQPAGPWDKALRAHTAVSQQRLGGVPHGSEETMAGACVGNLFFSLLKPGAKLV